MSRYPYPHIKPKTNAQIDTGFLGQHKPLGMFRARVGTAGSPTDSDRVAPGSYLRTRRTGHVAAALFTASILAFTALGDQSGANGPASGSEPAAPAAASALPTPAAVAGPSSAPSVPAPPPSAADGRGGRTGHRTLPRALDRIATNTAHNLDFVLLDRYADAGPLSLVQGAFESNLGKWGCAPQTNMLRYFLRVSPEYGAQQVRASMAERKDTECYRILLQDLGDKLSPAQQIAIDALDDPDPEVVQDAVIALGNWGTADAEAPLWASLQRLHDEWASRADELHMGPDFNSPTSHAAALEQGLAHAISAGRGWLCPPDKLARLSELLVISNERRQIDGLIKQWNDGTGTIDQQWVPEGSPTFTLLQYVQLTEAQLNAKLEQFPSGTKFAWQFWKPGQISPPVTMAKQEEFYERISAAAQQHGITIAKKIDP